MEARAVSRYIRISPRKARLVADLIRGKNVDEALGILALTPKKASPSCARPCSRPPPTSASGPTGDARLKNEDLLVKEILIDEGPTMKRIRPRAQGRAYRIIKRTAHIEVTVEGGV